MCSDVPPVSGLQTGASLQKCQHLTAQASPVCLHIAVGFVLKFLHTAQLQDKKLGHTLIKELAGDPPANLSAS